MAKAVYFKSGVVRPKKLEVQQELAELPVEKLQKEAKKRKIKVNDDASKAELIEAISEE